MGVEEPGHVWYCAVEVPGGAAGVLLELPALPGDGGGGAGEEVGMVGAGLGPPGPPQAGRLPRLLQARDPSALSSFVTLGIVRSQNTLNPLLLPRTPPEPATPEGCGPRPAGKAPRVSEFKLSAGHVDRGLVPLS